MTDSPLDYESIEIKANRFLGGRLRVPGSKSITQRYLNLALLQRSEEPVTIRGPLLSDDIVYFAGGLRQMGFEVEQGDGNLYITTTVPSIDEQEIYCGAGGTMLRFLTASLTAISGTYRLDGIKRLRQRTIEPLVKCLRELGAGIENLGTDGFAPIRLYGPTLQGGRTSLDAGASSQFLSALLMAGLKAEKRVEIKVEALTSEPYVDLTLDAIELFGGKVSRIGAIYYVEPSELSLNDVEVEPDFSSAAYPAAAAALTGATVFLEGLTQNSRQGDRAFLDLLAKMGAIVEWEDDGVRVQGSGELNAVIADLSAIPDQVPTLAALAPFAKGTTRIENVPHLRIKESDRLSAMTHGLRRLGAEVEELDDGLVITGVWNRGKIPNDKTAVDTWGDHRIAMSLALVGLRRPGVIIRDPGVVAKSYPTYWDDFAKLANG